MSRLVKVGHISEIGEGDRIVIEEEGESILVLRYGDKIYAVSNICTHEYAEMKHGLVVDDTITCPVHLSRFKLDTGEVLNPPAEKPLKTYRVVIKDDVVYVEI